MRFCCNMSGAANEMSLVLPYCIYYAMDLLYKVLHLFEPKQPIFSSQFVRAHFPLQMTPLFVATADAFDSGTPSHHWQKMNVNKRQPFAASAL